jgi:hypothetical protein
MDTTDEIPLEDHRYFRARLDHLETQHPIALLSYLLRGTLTEHLRDLTIMALRTRAEMVIHQNIPENQADEMVLHQLVADPQEQSHLPDPASRRTLQVLLNRFKATLSSLPRTYQSEIIE